MNSVIIQRLEYQYFNWPKQVVNFSKGVNVIVSEVNSVGKTTLVRIILFALGFDVKGTKGVDFEQLKYKILLKNYKDEDVELEKSELGEYAPLYIRVGEQTYTKTRADSADILKEYIYGIHSDILIRNILGAFYFDQEKGWNVLNRGRIIGANKFSVEEFLCGLGDEDIVCVKEEIAALKKEKKDFQKFLSVLELAEMPYDISLDEEEEGTTSQASIKSRAVLLDSQIKYFSAERKKLERIRSDNRNLAEYINSLKLFVVIKGERVRVNSNNLEGFEFNQEFLARRLSKLSEDISKLKKEREALVRTMHGFVSPDSLLSKYRKRLKELGLSVLDVKDSIFYLDERIGVLSARLRSSMSETYFKYVNNKIAEFMEVLGVRNPYPEDFNIVLLNRLYPLSGAELYKHIVSFKFSYILALREKFGINIPMVIDSPYAKELDDNNFNKVIKIIAKDFPDNQIILASIRDEIPFAHNRVSISDGVLENPLRVENVNPEQLHSSAVTPTT